MWVLSLQDCLNSFIVSLLLSYCPVRWPTRANALQKAKTTTGEKRGKLTPQNGSAPGHQGPPSIPFHSFTLQKSSKLDWSDILSSGTRSNLAHFRSLEWICRVSPLHLFWRLRSVCTCRPPWFAAFLSQLFWAFATPLPLSATLVLTR